VTLNARQVLSGDDEPIEPTYLNFEVTLKLSLRNSFIVDAVLPNLAGAQPT